MNNKLHEIEDWFRRGFIEDRDIEWLIERAKKIKQLRDLGDPTLWGGYEIEKYRELIWEEKE